LTPRGGPFPPFHPPFCLLAPQYFLSSLLKKNRKWLQQQLDCKQFREGIQIRKKLPGDKMN
jgi:hypothetical protein